MSTTWCTKPYNGVKTIDNYVLTTNGEGLKTQLLGGTFGTSISPITEKISEISYFNLRQNLFDFDYDMWVQESIGVTVGHSKVEGVKTNSSYDGITDGFYMGKYKHTPKNNDFTDFEPYSIFKVYLPYYGYTEIPIKEIYNKYIFFRLVIDFQSGLGTYFIYASDTDAVVEGTKSRFYLNTLGDARLISTYGCTVGVKVPITTNGSEARLRDQLITLAQTGIGTLGSLAIGYMGGSSVSTTTTTSPITTTYYTRNKATNRMIQDTRISQGGMTRTSTSEYTPSTQRSIVSECASASKSILATFVSNGVSTNTGSCISSFSDTQNIHIVELHSKVNPITSSYKYIYGLPLGRTANIYSLSGFTVMADFKLNHENMDQIDNNIGSITSKEYDMIQSLMKTGVYL